MSNWNNEGIGWWGRLLRRFIDLIYKLGDRINR